LAATTVATTELKELCHNEPPSLADLTMPSTSDTFKAAEDAKVIQIDAEDPTKTFQIGADLSNK
jgi:hypothetical protein